ncbi:MAG: hypothetical protein RLP15_13860 [Cryomorphaceae bacterium]
MRATAIIFAFFYLINSVGYGLEIHYCLGQVSDVNYVLLDTECPCDANHSASFSSCCEEKEFFNQLEDDHAAPASVSLSDVQLSMVSESPKASRLNLDLDEWKQEVITDRGPPRFRDITIELVRLITYG